MLVQRGLTFAGLILAFGLPIRTANAQAVQGNVDLVNSSTCEIAGWARDPQNTNPIQVLIYRDGDGTSGTLDTSFIANLLRTDLPFPDQNHGFDHVFIGDAGLADGKDHTIYVYGVSNSGVTAALSSNGQTLHCGVLTRHGNILRRHGQRHHGRLRCYSSCNRRYRSGRHGRHSGGHLHHRNKPRLVGNLRPGELWPSRRRACAEWAVRHENKCNDHGRRARKHPHARRQCQIAHYRMDSAKRPY